MGIFGNPSSSSSSKNEAPLHTINPPSLLVIILGTCAIAESPNKLSVTTIAALCSFLLLNQTINPHKQEEPELSSYPLLCHR